MPRVLAVLILIAVAPSLMAAEVTIGFERLQDEIRYHFDNDSNWDTPFLVPHFFEQTYSAGKNLAVVRARGAHWELELAATPVHTADGSDHDTFFQPDGDVVVHGTSTPVDARSWRAAYHYTIGGHWRAGYVYQRDHMKFPDSISTTTHTKPPSMATNLSTTRESVASDILEVRVGYSFSRPVGTSWEISGDAMLAPITAGRLTTYLPDKYPEPVRFTAYSFSGAGSATATWRSGRTSIAIGARLGGSRAYQKKRSLEREQAAVSFAIGYAIR